MADGSGTEFRYCVEKPLESPVSGTEFRYYIENP